MPLCWPLATFIEQTCSRSHGYWLPIVGEGVPIQLSVSDTSCLGNSGALTVGIYIPEPTTLGLLLVGVVAALKRRR